MIYNQRLIQVSVISHLDNLFSKKVAKLVLIAYMQYKSLYIRSVKNMEHPYIISTKYLLLR